MFGAVLPDIQNCQMKSKDLHQANHGVRFGRSQTRSPNSQKGSPDYPEIQNQILGMRVSIRIVPILRQEVTHQQNALPPRLFTVDRHSGFALRSDTLSPVHQPLLQLGRCAVIAAREGEMGCQTIERGANQLKCGRTVKLKTGLRGLRSDQRVSIPITAHPCPETQLGADCGMYRTVRTQGGNLPCFT